MAEPELLFFEDLFVGRRFLSAPHEVSAQEIKSFAAAYDPQPFHLDEEAARDSLFGGLAASGWLTGAVTMRLLVDSLPLAGGIIGVNVELRWPRPTRPGDALRVESEAVEAVASRSRPDAGLVTLRSVTRNQRDEAAQEMTAKLFVRRRPAPA